MAKQRRQYMYFKKSTGLLYRLDLVTGEFLVTYDALNERWTSTCHPNIRDLMIKSKRYGATVTPLLRMVTR